MGIVILVAVLVALGFMGWGIFRAVRGKHIKAHMVSYSIACVAGVFTYAYFLSLDISQLVKIVTSIVLGIILILAGALYQRRSGSRAEG
jgi:hypothetical protein